MKKLIELFDDIRMLDRLDMSRIFSGERLDYGNIFEPLEEILKEFYLYGYEQNPDIESDFKQKLMEFYKK